MQSPRMRFPCGQNENAQTFSGRGGSDRVKESKDRGHGEGEAEKVEAGLQGVRPSRCIIPLERAVQHVVCELFRRLVLVVPWHTTPRNEPRSAAEEDFLYTR